MSDDPLVIGMSIVTVVAVAIAVASWRRTRGVGSSGDLERLRMLLRDYIAEREETEDALQQSQERYRSLIERAYYGIYRSTPDGSFLEVNPALVRMLGYDAAEELLAVNLASIYANPGDREQLVAGATSGQLVPHAVDVEWLRKDSSRITVRLAGRPRYSRAGELEYFEVIVEDVSTRLRQEEMMRRSERMASLGTTLAGVAHELNNPLTAVIGFTQIMLKGARSEDDRESLTTIHREATRAARIVKDLLTFTRRQEGTREGQIDLNATVEYILSTRRYALETRGVRVTVQLASDLPRLTGDPSQIEQVVLNLLVNAEQSLSDALDAPPTDPTDISPRGEVAIVTVRDGGTAVLQVADTGCGIAAENLTRIWDPFWTTKPEGEGTGLGLSVVHGIVTDHGGSIEVDSETGRGTTFKVRFPLTAPPPEPRRAAPTGGDVAARPLDVLVVDDETAITSFLSRYLGARGHAVLTAQNGTEALAAAKQSEFDVVICDLRMPGMDGVQVLRALRELPGGERTRRILSTGAALSDATRVAIDELDVEVVPKPYDVEQLRRVIESD
jgi:PAS domain S-box-containing protein